MKKIFYIFLVLLTLESYGQELPIYSEYHLNKSLINPAIIGSEQFTWVKGTDRHQWVGIEGAPSVQTLSVEASVSNGRSIRQIDKKVHGLGAFLYRDKNGAYRNLGGQASYAYHITINKNKGINLGMGLSFRFTNSSLDERGFTKDVYDPIVNYNITSKFATDAGAGLFLYNDKFHVGLSAARLLQGKRNYFLMVGYLTGNKDNAIRFLPSLVFKTTDNLRKQIDINGKMLMNEIWWLSLSYRHSLDIMPGLPTAIIPMIGINMGNFTFGYAINITPGSIRKFHYGTHELLLSYQLRKSNLVYPYKNYVRRNW